MADEEKKENKSETPENAQPAATESAEKSKGSILQLVIVAVVVLILALSGFIVGRLLSSGPQTAEAQTEPTAATEQKPDLAVKDSAKAAAKGWFYPLDPVATNLAEPGSMRYVQAALILQMSPEVDEEKGTAFLDAKKPIIANLLNIYFAGLTIEDLNSDKDMRRIQSELADIFNEELYGDNKPFVQHVLFKEFGVQ